MGLIGWLVALGCLFIGAAIGIWGLTEFNKLIAIWAIGIPGALFLVAAGGIELHKLALEGGKPKIVTNDRRAYVFPDASEVANPPGSSPVVITNIKNSGQTPAYELTWRAKIAVSMVDDESKIALDPAAVGVKQPLPANQFLSYNYTFPAWDIRIDGLLLEEKAAIYVMGEIRYKDADGIDRYVDYLLKSGGRFGIKSGTTPGRFSTVYTKSN
jgi:hypothetical protein